MAAGDITIESEDIWGTKNVVLGTVELPSSYGAGGQALGTVKFGLTDVDFVDMEIVEVDADEVIVPRYDYATDKVQLYEGDADVSGGDSLQEIGADNVSALVCRFLAIGHKR